MSGETSVAHRVRRFYETNSRAFLENRNDFDSGAADLSIHRQILDPGTGKYSTGIINEEIAALLRDHFGENGKPRILDAGCGWGGTLFALERELSITGTGVTLCPLQAQRAMSIAAQQESAIRFIEGDFRAEIVGGPFDCIIAIESIAHTASFAETISKLATHLTDDGIMLVVDDFLAEGVKQSDPNVRLFKDGWIVEAVDTFDTIKAELRQRSGLSIDVTQDFSDRVFRRDITDCFNLIGGLDPDELVLEEDDRKRCDIGGVALEVLYHKGQSRYLMCAVTSPERRG